jgi:hypothetical protein
MHECREENIWIQANPQKHFTKEMIRWIFRLFDCFLSPKPMMKRKFFRNQALSMFAGINSLLLDKHNFNTLLAKEASLVTILLINTQNFLYSHPPNSDVSNH